MAQNKDYPRATIYWDDAWSRDMRWTDQENFAKELLQDSPMKTTGWIIAQNKKRIAMAFEFDVDDGGSRKVQSIPRKLISRVEYLEPVQPKTGRK